MADILISGLTAAASLAGTDVLEIDTGTLSRKVTGTQIQTFVLNGVTLTELAILDGATLTTTELNYVDGVTSAIQTQIDGKAATVHTHLLAAVTDVTASAAEVNLLDGVTASTAELNIVDGITATTAEINFIDGVTSNVQTQLDARALNTRTISTTAPLTGGGDLSANRTFALDITGTASTTVATGDEILVYDISLSGIRKTTAGDIAALGGGGGGVPTSRLINTTAPIAGGGDLSADRTLTFNLTGLAADTPVSADEFIFYDASGADLNKVTLTNLKTALNAGYTASRAVETDGSGVLQVSATTAADLAEIAGIANFTEGLRVYLTPVTSSTTGAITLSTTQQNSFVYCTNASTATFTIPPNSTTAYAVGTEIEFWRSDASVVITEGSGVTLNGHDGTSAVTTTATIGTQHTGCCIKKVATDTWVVFGRFTAS